MIRPPDRHHYLHIDFASGVSPLGRALNWVFESLIAATIGIGQIKCGIGRRIEASEAFSEAKRPSSVTSFGLRQGIETCRMGATARLSRWDPF